MNWFYVASYLLVINCVTFLLFGVDKRAAERGQYRISENALLLASAAGGSLGAMLAQNRFRHKTKKQPFKTFFRLILVAQIFLVASLFYKWI